MTASLFPTTVSGNRAPGNLLDAHMGTKTQEVEAATWYLNEGKPIPVYIMARAKRPVRHLRYRLNVAINEPEKLKNQHICAVLIARRGDLKTAALTGILNCELGEYCESPAHLLKVAKSLKREDDREKDTDDDASVFLFTLDFPLIKLAFPLATTVEISAGVSKVLEEDALAFQAQLDEDDRTEEEEGEEAGDDFADDDVINLAPALTKGPYDDVYGIDDESLATVCETLGPSLGISPAALRKLLDDVAENPEHYECAAGGTDRDDEGDSLGEFDSDGLPPVIAITTDGAALRSNGDITRLSLVGHEVGA